MNRQKRPIRKQPTPLEIRDELLRFIESKFYQGDAVNFAKDRPRLLKLVVLKFADWLDEKGVTLSASRYLEIMRDKVLMEAVRFGRTDEIKYRPGWLSVVVDRHLAHHGEDYYDEAKAIRNLVDNALTLAQGNAKERDPIRELAQASRLLKPMPMRVPLVFNHRFCGRLFEYNRFQNGLSRGTSSQTVRGSCGRV